ncbi:hypothetical protein bcgnr5416_23810 [Bacillus cereus]|nr:hypothetical protein BCJMU07_2115 [Bacillus cereus]BCC76470.1 hypothetical protein BCJMU62_2161 [Bacillus cereus]
MPTDCPQRDDRLGWTGDAQMFIGTATQIMNVQLFFKKWLQDLSLDQNENAAVPLVIPDAFGKREDFDLDTSGGWVMQLLFVHGFTICITEMYRF